MERELSMLSQRNEALSQQYEVLRRLVIDIGYLTFKACCKSRSMLKKVIKPHISSMQLVETHLSVKSTNSTV